MDPYKKQGPQDLPLSLAKQLFAIYLPYQCRSSAECFPPFVIKPKPLTTAYPDEF